MTIRKKTSRSLQFLERLTGGPLTFGELLESIRMGEGWTQVMFAKKLGISKSHLCDLEKGRKAVSLDRAARWARRLGYSEEQFVRLAIQALVVKARLRFRVEVQAA